MTYADFKETYKKTLKKYPGISELYESNFKIQQIKTNYKKNGSRWAELETKTEEVNYIFYNVIDAIPFFRNLGGTERVKMAYTVAGYIPTEVGSISPDKQEKVVYSYRFTL